MRRETSVGKEALVAHPKKFCCVEKPRTIFFQKKKRGWRGWSAHLDSCETVPIVLTENPIKRKFVPKRAASIQRPNRLGTSVSTERACSQKG